MAFFAPETAAEFRALDRQLMPCTGSFATRLLVITADHGMIDTTAAVDIAKTPALLEPLVLPPSIEPRAAAFHVKNHRRAAFEAAFQEICGGDFRLFSREEALSSGLLGRGTPHPKLDDFLGDYLGVATGRRYFAFPCPGRSPGTD